MDFTRVLTTRFIRFWRWLLLLLAVLALLSALASHWHQARVQQQQITVLQQQLQQHYQAGELAGAEHWLLPLLALSDVKEVRLWRGQQLWQRFGNAQDDTGLRSLRLPLGSGQQLQAEFLLPGWWHGYFPSFGDGLLLIILILLAVMLLPGYRWHVTLLQEMQRLTERCRLVKQGKYAQARQLHSTESPHFIHGTLNQLLDALLDARKERARFDKFIRSNTFLDHETRIGNRLFLDNRLDALSNAQGMMAHGVLLLLEFEALEQLGGEAQVREYLHLNIAHINRLLQSQANSVFARRSHHQLAIVVTQISLAEAEQLAAKLMKLCVTLIPPELENPRNSCHLGGAYFKLGDNQQQLLEEAEMALKVAQIQGNNTWFMYDKGAVDAEFARGSVRWRSFLEVALAQRRFVTFVQPVLDTDGNLHHREVFTRAKDGNGALVRATLFLPMATKCGLMPQIERQTLERVIQQLLPKAEPEAVFSINLSEDTLMNNGFMRWVRTLLLEHRDMAPRLIFEVDEALASRCATLLQPKLRLLRKMGARVCVDQVGSQVVSSQYIIESGFSLVKLHRSLVKQIHLRPENQLFIRSLMGGLHKTEIEVMAEGVELFEEWQTLRVLGVSAAQGTWFAEPELM
ncbi:EAL domain-containing protein [Shewanella sp. YIC-542]|uniref:EAL domain-containing protein n=1 Tax=Shewanella mytili TaxID=3377111 RepID=UPI00398E5363